MPALAGANLIYGLGMIESGMTFDFGQLVMDNEFAGMIKQCVRGIRVDDESLAVDVIGEIGPFGDFLSHDHTMAHMREQSQPAFIDRRVREDWKANGSTTIQDRALAKARTILETHVPDPLPEGVAEQFVEIIRAPSASSAWRDGALPQAGGSVRPSSAPAPAAPARARATPPQPPAAVLQAWEDPPRSGARGRGRPCPGAQPPPASPRCSTPFLDASPCGGSELVSMSIRAYRITK